MLVYIQKHETKIWWTITHNFTFKLKSRVNYFLPKVLSLYFIVNFKLRVPSTFRFSNRRPISIVNFSILIIVVKLDLKFRSEKDVKNQGSTLYLAQWVALLVTNEWYLYYKRWVEREVFKHQTLIYQMLYHSSLKHKIFW